MNHDVQRCSYMCFIIVTKYFQTNKLMVFLHYLQTYKLPNLNELWQEVDLTAPWIDPRDLRRLRHRRQNVWEWPAGYPQLS